MRLLNLFAAILLASSCAAHADTLQYTFVQAYANQPTHTFSFQLPSNPSLQSLTISAANQAFYLGNVAAVADGVPGTFLAVFVFNQIDPHNDGFVLAAGPYSNEPTFSYSDYSGMPLYSGEPFDPMFLTGTFVLQEIGSPYGGALGILTVTDLTAPTPEPSALALLTTGLLGTASLLRRRVIVSR